jgi:DNA topoisomerase-3
MVRAITDEVIFNTHRPMQFFNTAEKKTAIPKKRIKKTISFDETDCPKCNSNKLMKGNTAIGCANFKVCGFKVPFELMGKKLSDNQLNDLIKKKKTNWIKGITNPKDQQKIEGRFIMDAQFNVAFDQKP